MKHLPMRVIVPTTLGITLLMSGCAADRTEPAEFAVRDAIDRYGARHAESADATSKYGRPDASRDAGLAFPYYTLGMAPEEPPQSQPTARDESRGSVSDRDSSSRAGRVAGVPEGYWRRNIWHQMGYEAKQFGGREFWRGFKTSFWDVENALALTATMGASVAIRETGVDDAIRRRTHGSRQLGNLDEPIQILGNPATHFAGAGVLWLSSTLAKDAETHELARSLTQALAVNGVTTIALKAAANTTAPNGDTQVWPSGHTSSAFTVAAVLNEHYGPWVGVPSLALAGLVGYQRVDSRVHDFSDVIFGAMLGYVVGTSIARDEQARFPEIFGMTVVPFNDPQTGATGLALMKSW